MEGMIEGKGRGRLGEKKLEENEEVQEGKRKR